MKQLNNMAASVRQRLLDKARKEHRPFAELLQCYAMERFLYRLSCTKYAERFILKGAMALQTWFNVPFRPTRDIDRLGRIANEKANLIGVFQEIMNLDVAADGMCFDATYTPIAQDAEYEGVRIEFWGNMETARVKMQIDIGFGDAVYPLPKIMEFPIILDNPIPCLLCYSRESVIAEKFEIMVKLGVLNSRMKNFYDVWYLSRNVSFDEATLHKAIRQTFRKRGTELAFPIEAFSEAFAREKQTQWQAFRKKLQQDSIKPHLNIDSLMRFYRAFHQLWSRDFLVPLCAFVAVWGVTKGRAKTCRMQTAPVRKTGTDMARRQTPSAPICRCPMPCPWLQRAEQCGVGRTACMPAKVPATLAGANPKWPASLAKIRGRRGGVCAKLPLNGSSTKWRGPRKPTAIAHPCDTTVRCLAHIASLC